MITYDMSVRNLSLLKFPLGYVILEAVGKYKGLKFAIDTTLERNILFADRVNESGYDVFDDWELFTVTHQNGYPLENGGMQITDFVIEIKLKFDNQQKRAEKLIFEYSDSFKEYQQAVDECIGTSVHGVLGLPYLACHQHILQIGAKTCKSSLDDILTSWGQTQEELKIHF